MAEIIEEKRRSPISGKIDFEERRKVQFFIDRIEGLTSGGFQFLPSPYYVSVENVERSQSVATRKGEKKGSIVSWGNNVLIPHLAESSQVRFELQQEVTSLLNKRMAVVGTTDVFDVRQLQDMQTQVGGGPTARIELNVNLSQQPPPSPRTPVTGKRSSSPTPPATTQQKGSKSATLHLRIKVLSTQDGNLNMAHTNKKRFAEQCRAESLEHLTGFTEKMGRLREAVDGSEFVCLIDMILGVCAGVQKQLTESDLHNENKNTSGLLEALDSAFVPSQSLSARKLAKTGQQGTETMQEMLCAAIKALRSIDAFLRQPDALVRDKLEFKLNDWIQYYQACEKHLLDPANVVKPKLPTHRTSRRIHCPTSMVKHPELIQHNMIPMELPQVYAHGGYNRSDLVRLVAEWVLLSSSSTFSRPPSPTMARGIVIVNGDANASGRVKADELKPLNNVLCLVGVSGCGKTLLIAHISEWLAKTGCLGGYFSFDPSAASPSPDNVSSTPRTTSDLLDALPMTLVHQACTVEPDAYSKFSSVLSQNSGALHEPLETRFEKLFAKPIKAFADGREGAKWNQLDPLVFVIDGLGAGSSEREGKEAEDEKKVLDAFVSWMSSKGTRSLPSYVKFVVVCRSETGVAEKLKEKGAVVCEMASRPGDDVVIGPVPASTIAGSSSSNGSAPPTTGEKEKEKAFL
ncbi:hypothetical protein NLJ89_g5767 [Agrocybe chaxingu]|uniref:Nephrocystin 3-like N-terminal domain-containing protein n=1 Tax=Agrocybe chaxingu TaxID=84603 RepID=A0A9W8MWM9_9AGAR|nr:hypothetical protein NLJ89_g5767 [Agrocybe chaxingu]